MTLSKAVVGVIMGSRSDWETLVHTTETLELLEIPYEAQVVSAHRTPDRLFEYAASAKGRGLCIIIAGAGGAAHLPGMVAAKTTLPVLGVPVQSQALSGMDSLLSMVQMPAGIPVGTLAIGKAGAINAALLAASILAVSDAKLAKRLEQYPDGSDRRGPFQSPSAVKIGVLGAGQLGRMLALAGHPLGFEFLFLDPAEEACAATLGEHLRADYQDEAALTELCGRSDLVTYEFENVPAAAAAFVAQRRALQPSLKALTVGQDRLSEKTLFSELGIPVPRFLPIATAQELRDGVAMLGYPAVLKTRRLGYDGKGQAVLRHPEDLDRAWTRLGGQPLILEAFVAFEREVALLGARSATGELAFYPLVETSHRDGILRTARPRAGDPLQTIAESYVQRVLERLDYVGVLAFEFFVRSQALLGNEIAPRVHNSGHWTIEGAQCSQFENHLRAIAGLPLGDTALRGPCAMANFIGRAPTLSQLAALPGVHVHLYGKAAKPLRKIGHGTVLATSESELDQRLHRLTALVDAAE